MTGCFADQYQNGDLDFDGTQSLGGVPRSGRACLWNFGASIPGQTVQDFGRDAQYGAPDLSFYGGTLISKVQANPQFSGKCR